MVRSIALWYGPDGLVHVEDESMDHAPEIYVLCERRHYGYLTETLLRSEARVPTCFRCAIEPIIPKP